jgi:hypothetical protein
VEELFGESISYFQIPAQHNYLVFQPNRNLPPVFQKSHLNLLYKLNQKDNFILKKFQTPPLSLSLPFLKIAKSQTPFSLSIARRSPLCYLSPLLRHRRRHCPTSPFSALKRKKNKMKNKMRKVLKIKIEKIKRKNP